MVGCTKPECASRLLLTSPWANIKRYYPVRAIPNATMKYRLCNAIAYPIHNIGKRDEVLQRLRHRSIQKLKLQKKTITLIIIILFIRTDFLNCITYFSRTSVLAKAEMQEECST